MSEFDKTPDRSEPRRYLALLLITAATALALGHTLRQPTQMAANDISRWCTVWSLLERGSYKIDECPWQIDTQDKVFRAAKTPDGAHDAEPTAGHYYSSKPALLPTLIAGILYPARWATGVPLDRVVLQARAERWTQKADPDSPYKVKGVLETPKEPVRWPAYVFYFKPILILLNVIPFGGFLIFFARVLDRYAQSDWTWFFCSVAASFGTYLLPFSQTLNNHTVAAYSAFFAVYQLLRIWEAHDVAGWRFALAGFCAAFAFANELPALALLVLVAGLLALRHPRQSLVFLVPAALLPIAAFAAAQYAALGELKLQYESFGSDEYLYEGSLWKTPLELDAFNDHPESYATYFFHLTCGHHGVFSLTPIFLFSALGTVRLLWGRRWFLPDLRRDDSMKIVAWLVAVLTVVLLAFYTWNPKARNYGGSTQGLRWLFWLIPLWLLVLPQGVAGGERRRWVRGLAVLALGISVASVGYAIRNPWSHPWILDALEHLNLYPLNR
jgi:hypothetical protein